MPILKISTPGKTILFGEHAVVYGYPAIAVPISQLRATFTISPKIKSASNEIVINAPDIGLNQPLFDLQQEHPFRIAFDIVKSELKLESYPACELKIKSDIPVSSGLGSSAAISVGLVKTFSQFIGANLPTKKINELAYQVEVAFHGTPSGVDNTVVAYERPLIYRKGKDIHFLSIEKAFHILIANSGIIGNTKEAVAGVRNRWIKNEVQYNKYFTEIGQITEHAIQTLDSGDITQLGNLMTKNHELLQIIGVSHPMLDKMVNTALEHGALGAKLCGGGLGGNIIALVKTEQCDAIIACLESIGAAQIFLTKIESIQS